MIDLFSDFDANATFRTPNLTYLAGFALPHQAQLLKDLQVVLQMAPLRQMMTPMGHLMSVRTTSCGQLGWVSDKMGYRYATHDPITHQPWPTMAVSFFDLAQSAAALAGFHDFCPDACLINQYDIGTKMGLHQDKNEQDYSQPIVSVSLGISARFQFGGQTRRDKTYELTLHHGDVVVWGNEARRYYHGIKPIQAQQHPILGAVRYNLTFRRAG
jgi:DNA oxidative demethylase